MDRSELLEYAQKRRQHIGKNKMGDVFCSACFQATMPGEPNIDVSACCGKSILAKEDALIRIEAIIKKLRFAVPQSEKLARLEEEQNG